MVTDPVEGEKKSDLTPNGSSGHRDKKVLGSDPLGVVSFPGSFGGEGS